MERGRLLKVSVLIYLEHHGYKICYRNETTFRLCTNRTENLRSPDTDTCRIKDFGHYITTDEQKLEVSIKVNANNKVGNYTTKIIKFIVSENGKFEVGLTLSISLCVFTTKKYVLIPESSDKFLLPYFSKTRKSEAHSNRSIIFQRIEDKLGLPETWSLV